MKTITEHHYRIWLFTIWIVVFSLGLAETSAQAATKSSSDVPQLVSLQNGQVSIDVLDMPLPTVLNRLSLAGNFQVRYDQSLDTVLVSETFYDVPLKVALERLLLQTDYAIINFPAHTTDTPEALFEVIVMKRPGNTAHHSASGTASSGENIGGQLPDSQQPPISHNPQLAQSPTLPVTVQEDQGETEESLRAVADLGQDEDVRLPALKTLIDRLENDPEDPEGIRSTVLSALREQDEALQTALLESLDESDSHLSLPMLSELARFGETEDIRLEALESLTDKAIDGTIPTNDVYQVRMRLEESLKDPNPDVQEEARDLLEELDQESD